MAPTKRSWEEANAGSDLDAASVLQGSSSRHGSQPTRPLHVAAAASDASATSPTGAVPASQHASNGGMGGSASQHVPMISRKIRACASCRKHKIKCIMDENAGPPCKRCAEKNLGCVLNKSIQTLITERSRSSLAMVHDLEIIHASLDEVLKTLQLPQLAKLQSPTQMLLSPSYEEHSEARIPDEFGLSRDSSPKPSPEDEHELPKVPINSVYQLTKLRALRSPDHLEQNEAPRHPSAKVDDLVSRGILSVEDAERLFTLYKDHLDPFMYGIGGRYETLETLRHGSGILTVCIFTVSALHDPESDRIYGECRRLLASSMFERRIDADYLRAMCIASYWLSDISWEVSGCAIRRAAEFNLIRHFKKATEEGSEDSADYVRLWYVLHICDQHLSTLYGRQPIIREDLAIQGWKTFMAQSPPKTMSEDTRLASQVALVNIIHAIRDLFGPDTGDPVPQVYSMQITQFSRQLDQWVGHWSGAVIEHHERIGTFPRKGVLLHFHFAKLHLYSHVFRGLRKNPIPSYFLEPASSAAAAATAIIDLLIADADIQPALAGMPSYMHSMSGFACMFLAKLAMIHGDQLIERQKVVDSITRLAGFYRSTPVGKWHLVNLMADGLDKIVETLRATGTSMSSAQPRLELATAESEGGDFASLMNPGFSGESAFSFDANFLLDSNMSLGAPELMYFSNGTNMSGMTDNFSPDSL
ncbi:hypothetical protein J7T55_012215 [Diaporthe amygdali]|uniref:uncharacterized protein n=1 Tax=Phomopsis amygdali TaxID=1214568 RepID=UPI0022FE5FAB|nr:uncharacterized protein J7T55_012215 [Diaporthe amygdali]KAJ0123746.1 hypothetical protein J7T55_012215 [Diaporthe amygdali]